MQLGKPGEDGLVLSEVCTQRVASAGDAMTGAAHDVGVLK